MRSSNRQTPVLFFFRAFCARPSLPKRSAGFFQPKNYVTTQNIRDPTRLRSITFFPYLFRVDIGLLRVLSNQKLGAGPTVSVFNQWCSRGGGSSSAGKRWINFRAVFRKAESRLGFFFTRELCRRVWILCNAYFITWFDVLLTWFVTFVEIPDKENAIGMANFLCNRNAL